MHHRNHQQRRAFTLIELLVVIALIMILAGMGAAFLPAIGETARQAQAASGLQQWILTAKQKALRDQVPCGLRLLVDPAVGYPYQVRQCQYIEQPEDFPPAIGSTISGGGGAGNMTVSVNTYSEVAVGDYVEVLGSGLMHRITSVIPGQLTSLVVSPPLANPVLAGTKQYRIVRAQRVTGDDILQFTDPVIIDLQTNATYGNPLPTANVDTSTPPRVISYDILFAPSGAVLSPGTTTDSINLWVRDHDPGAPRRADGTDGTQADPTDGQQTIIAIYVRSGLTAAHPPAGFADPYAFIKDGKTSGK